MKKKGMMTIGERLDYLENQLSVLDTVYVDSNTKGIRELNDKINLLFDHLNIKVESGKHITETIDPIINFQGKIDGDKLFQGIKNVMDKYIK